MAREGYPMLTKLDVIEQLLTMDGPDDDRSDDEWPAEVNRRAEYATRNLAEAASLLLETADPIELGERLHDEVLAGRLRTESNRRHEDFQSRVRGG